jgi:RNA polymerase sigma factor (sigma-70 family)
VLEEQIKSSMFDKLATIIAEKVVEILKKSNLVKDNSKTAYQKTEQLLYHYKSFKKVIKERELEIETIKQYGVPQRSTSIVGYTPKTNSVPSMNLESDVVENAVRNVQASIYDTVQVIAMIDKAMDSLKQDPYFKILEMRYFDGITQEEIADHFGVSQVTISNNKNRLVRRLSIELFPSQAV